MLITLRQTSFFPSLILFVRGAHYDQFYVCHDKDTHKHNAHEALTPTPALCKMYPPQRPIQMPISSLAILPLQVPGDIAIISFSSQVAFVTCNKNTLRNNALRSSC